MDAQNITTKILKIIEKFFFIEEKMLIDWATIKSLIEGGREAPLLHGMMQNKTWFLLQDSTHPTLPTVVPNILIKEGLRISISNFNWL